MKPSEIIMQKVRAQTNELRAKKIFLDLADGLNIALTAITDYLDEEYEKNKPSAYIDKVLDD